VRIHAREHRRARAALQGAGSTAAVQGPVRLAGVGPVGARLCVHHARPAADRVGALRRLARARPRPVLHVWLHAQPAQAPRAVNNVLALDGVRVLDLTRLLPGAYATLALADLGADVVKLEDPCGGDPTRTVPPIVDGSSVYHQLFNRNKRSIAIDLRSAE